MNQHSPFLDRPLRSETEARDQIKRDTDALDAWRAKNDAQALVIQHNANACLAQFRAIIELFETPGSGIK